MGQQKRQHGSSSSSASTSKQPKKSINLSSADPISFLIMCALVVAKRFVFPPIHIKIGIYMSALLVCSVLKDFHFINHTNYLAQKNNVLNLYFVKLGWAWTLVSCVPFVLMTSLVYTGKNLSIVKNHLARLLVATLGWYVWTSLFERIDAATGRCTNRDLKTKYECKRGGKYEWINSFDISGHTFILMHSLFLMIEEVRVFNDWDSLHRRISDKLSLDETSSAAEIKPRSINTATIDNPFRRAEILYKLFSPFIKINFIFMSVLALLWEVMLLTTFLYYHTIMHKLVASFFAISTWFLTYKMWYTSKTMSPGLPGDGSI